MMNAILNFIARMLTNNIFLQSKVYGLKLNKYQNLEIKKVFQSLNYGKLF